MVQRVSEQVKFGGGGRVQVADSAMGFARLDENKYKVSHEFSAPMALESSGDRLLNRIAGNVGQLAKQAMAHQQEEAYLAGAAAAGTVASEKDLKTSPLTSAWSKAGYRDTMGRVAMAEAEAKIMEDMPKMREKSPEEYNAYLAERRAKLVPTLEGMSRQQRTAVFQNLLMSDRSAIKSHTSEHMKYQIEVQTGSLQAMALQHNRALKAAKGDDATYDAATKNAYTAYNAGFIQNPNLTPAARNKVLAEAAISALDEDNTPLYEMMNEMPMPNPDGTVNENSRPMLDVLSFDERAKLGEKYRASQGRTQELRASQHQQQLGKLKADLDNPDTPVPPEEAMIAFVNHAKQNKFMGDATSFWDEYYSKGAKKVGAMELGAAYRAGDSGHIIRSGKTDQEAFEAWKMGYGRKMEPAQYVQELTGMAIVGGRVTAGTELGKVMAPAWAQLTSTDVMDPANAQMAWTVIRQFTEAETSGKTGLLSSLTSSYSTAEMTKVAHMIDAVKAGKTPAEAVLYVKDRLDKEDKLGVQGRAYQAQQFAKSDHEFVTSMEPIGMFKKMGLQIASMFPGRDSGNEAVIRTRSHWMESPDRVAAVGQSIKPAIYEELEHLHRAAPFMSPESAQSAALAAVAGRTINTETGVLVIPRGQSAAAFFGVPASTGGERIGKAVDEIAHIGPNSRLELSIVDKKIMFTERGKDNDVLRHGVISPTEVGKKVLEQQGRWAAEFKETHGGGREYKGLTFNGRNTSGADPKMAFDTRQALLTSGAFGLNLGKSHTPAQLKGASDIFKVTTDIGITGAGKVMKATGLKSTEAMTFFAEAHITTDGKFVKDKANQPFLQAMANSDPAAAVRTLKATTLYTSATPEFKARYEAAIKKIITERHSRVVEFDRTVRAR